MIHDVEQGSPEWLKLKAGKFTASEISALMAGKNTKTYKDYIRKIEYGIRTGECPESFQSDWMQRGKELESVARDAYEIENFVKVQQIGFVEFDKWIGCSPDGFVGENGMIQIKCPAWNTWMEYEESGKIPADYILQCQFEMYVCRKEWNDLYFYHPKLGSITNRILRDENIIQSILKEIEFAKQTILRRAA